MAEIRIRRRNQFTMPATVVKAVGLVDGDRFLVTYDPEDPDTILFRVIDRRHQRSLAGTLDHKVGRRPPDESWPVLREAARDSP
jgi:bifunctional DNA-binding transcriptional regulator/antitoxin component of YhaV-PrlF toxin-antitoxin module